MKFLKATSSLPAGTSTEAQRLCRPPDQDSDRGEGAGGHRPRGEQDKECESAEVYGSSPGAENEVKQPEYPQVCLGLRCQHRPRSARFRGKKRIAPARAAGTIASVCLRTPPLAAAEWGEAGPGVAGGADTVRRGSACPNCGAACFPTSPPPLHDIPRDPFPSPRSPPYLVATHPAFRASLCTERAISEKSPTLAILVPDSGRGSTVCVRSRLSRLEGKARSRSFHGDRWCPGHRGCRGTEWRPARVL